MAFEQVLVNQLSKELASTAPSSDGSDGSDGGDGTDSSSGLMGSDPANNMYAQLLPTALSSGVIGAGGIGIAQQLASALDPSLGAGIGDGWDSIGDRNHRRQRRHGIERRDHAHRRGRALSDDSFRCNLDRLLRARRGHEHDRIFTLERGP